jgi:predicted hydrocarbon binding protein
MSTATTPSTDQVRPELGDFSSIVCFKAMVVGAEDALGEKAAAITLIAAGRKRGKQLATELNLSNSEKSIEDIGPILNAALGKEGTRLCIIDRVTREEESIKVFCRETICSSGEPQGSNRQLTYTLGAIQGALEEITGKRLRGKQVESVLRGSNYDVLRFEPIA